MFLYQSVGYIAVLRKITFITFVSLKSAINVNLFFGKFASCPSPILLGAVFAFVSLSHTHGRRKRGEGGRESDKSSFRSSRWFCGTLDTPLSNQCGRGAMR